MKTAIFVIGEERSGKSSIIRALTGQGGQKYEWTVRSLNNRQIKAFVITSALQEDKITKKIPLDNEFLEILEKRYHIQEYKLLICPLEIKVSKRRYTFDKYLQLFIAQGFNVKVAIIEKSWDNKAPDSNLLSQVQRFLSSNKLESILLDIHNSDEHLEAHKLRTHLYPID